ncbi:MAG: hypothetical protein Q7S68_01950, partial [Deltaproteobacteria bacterium]|nr:hypothetical protein [Deltaproteobacteria bacterium]
AIAIFSQFNFPTGSREKWTGERGMTWEYRVVGEKAFTVLGSKFEVLGNVGFKVRKEVQVLASNYGDTFTFGVGGRYHLPWQNKSWAVESELVGESFFADTRDSGVPMEWRLGGRKKLDEKKNILFGIGRGLTNSVGAPQFRLFGGVQWNF